MLSSLIVCAPAIWRKTPMFRGLRIPRYVLRMMSQALSTLGEKFGEENGLLYFLVKSLSDM